MEFGTITEMTMPGDVPSGALIEIARDLRAQAQS